MKFSQNYDMIVFNIFVQLTVSYDYRIYVHTHTYLGAMPNTQRTNSRTTRSLTQSIDSTYGEFLSRDFYLLGFACLLAWLLAYYLRYLQYGIADLTRPQLPKCNNHLVSFIKVYGLFVPYIVDIFNTIKSRTMVYRSMDCRHFWHH